MSPPAVLGFIVDLPNAGWVVIAFAIVVIIVAGTIAAVILDRRGLEFEIDGKALRFGLRRRPQDDARSLRFKAALLRLGDLEEGLAALPAADEAALARWFTYFCENMAWVLAVGTHLHYRVALWSDDDDDPTILRKVALHGFDRNDPRMEQLDRAKSVAGWCVDHGTAYYVRDTKNDLIYRPRRSQPAYRSMYAVPLGTSTDPWAVLTADVDMLAGFTDDQIELIGRFGKLATTGAALATPTATEEPDDTSGHPDEESVYSGDGHPASAQEGGQSP